MAWTMLDRAWGGGGSSPLLGRVRGWGCGVAAIAAALSLASCAVLPASAPTAGEIESVANNPSDGVFVFDLDQNVIGALASTHQDSFVGRFSSRAPAADLRIAVGDTLQIAVIDEASGLFGRSNESSSTGFGSTTLLPVTVGRNGDISVPFAGEIRAAGLTIDDLRAKIERKLSDKGVNPQVQVVMAPTTSVGANSATVGGEVTHSGVFALRPSGSRLLDLIAEAGAARFPAYETTVHLTRGKREASVSLQRIVNRMDENIYVYPGDSIYLSHDPKTFSVLGASTKVGRSHLAPRTSILLKLSRRQAVSSITSPTRRGCSCSATSPPNWSRRFGQTPRRPPVRLFPSSIGSICATATGSSAPGSLRCATRTSSCWRMPMERSC